MDGDLDRVALKLKEIPTREKTAIQNGQRFVY